MSTMSVRLPNSLHRQLRELAERSGVSAPMLSQVERGETLALLGTSGSAGANQPTFSFSISCSSSCLSGC